MNVPSPPRWPLLCVELAFPVAALLATAGAVCDDGAGPWRAAGFRAVAMALPDSVDLLVW